MTTPSFHDLIAGQRNKGAPPVFNIPPGVSFVDRLAETMLGWADGNPLHLTEYLVLLPGRRACRSLREAFLRLTDGAPLLLPRMQSVGDVDDDALEILLSATLAEHDGEGGEAEAKNIFDVRPAITPLHRQILLARIIYAAAKKDASAAGSYEQALSLAAELSKFLDEVQTERCGFDRLQTLVTEEKFAAHWQLTLDFLAIVTQHWPHILAELGMIDPAERRNRLLEAQTRLWQKQPPRQKLVVAGITGSVPAVRDLIKAAVDLPEAMLVLPGLDVLAEEEDWPHIADDHPQFYLKLLLEHLEVQRRDVAPWPSAEAETSVAAFISEAMRPAVTSDGWRRLKNSDIIKETALKNLRKIDCETAQDEAFVIALAMRGALETPGKTAVLVTPDRNLSARVQACLRRWDITCDDSAGRALPETDAGRFLLLAADAARDMNSPVALLSCLRHPLATAAMQPEEMRIWQNMLDRTLRSVTPAEIPAAFEKIKVQNPEAGEAALRGWTSVTEALAPFRDLCVCGDTQPLPSWIAAHLAAAETLAATPEKAGAERLWRGHDGEAAARFFQDISDFAGDVPDLRVTQYMSLLQNLMKTAVVRPRYSLHPRLAILGQMEARLYSADLVILGGLNEGTWPHDPGHDPWMSRPMRKEYGLPPTERRIGMEAHDFVQSICAPEVIVTRAKNVDGTPTVPARWLLRMETVLHAAGLHWPDAGELPDYAEMFDAPLKITPCARPAPCPPVAARPRCLSVTRVETWMRDPYGIYARYILGLKPLNPLERPPGAAERGQIMHKILEGFVREHCLDGVPENAHEILLEYGRREFEEMKLPDEVFVFWWPRFERMAAELIRHEREWQQAARPVLVEAKGECAFEAPAGPFALTARADRIDVMRDSGAAAVIDYKTGAAPNAADIVSGHAPQLPLEALLVSGSGFSGLETSKVAELLVWIVSGGNPPFKAQNYSPDTLRRAVANAQKGFPALVEAFDRENTPYYAVPDFAKAPAYNDYAHLERLPEWGYVEKL